MSRKGAERQTRIISAYYTYPNAKLVILLHTKHTYLANVGKLLGWDEEYDRNEEEQ